VWFPPSSSLCWWPGEEKLESWGSSRICLRMLKTFVSHFGVIRHLIHSFYTVLCVHEICIFNEWRSVIHIRAFRTTSDLSLHVQQDHMLHVQVLHLQNLCFYIHWFVFSCSFFHTIELIFSICKFYTQWLINDTDLLDEQVIHIHESQADLKCTPIKWLLNQSTF